MIFITESELYIWIFLTLRRQMSHYRISHINREAFSLLLWLTCISFAYRYPTVLFKLGPVSTIIGPFTKDRMTANFSHEFHFPFTGNSWFHSSNDEFSHSELPPSREELSCPTNSKVFLARIVLPQRNLSKPCTWQHVLRSSLQGRLFHREGSPPVPPRHLHSLLRASRSLTCSFKD